MKKKEILNIKGLKISANKNGKRVILIDDISFNIYQGQIVGIIGETGSGKTLTMLAVMGMLPRGMMIESGTIMFDEENLIDKTDDEMRRIKGHEIAMIFQSQKSSMSPVYKISTQMRDIIKIYKKLTNKQLDNYCLELLHQVGFDNPKDVYNKYPFEISGGMFQRVMLAIAMSMSPKLLIADEPTTALDAEVKNNMLSAIKIFQQKLNNSIIIVTHDFSIVKKICTDVVVMKQGRVIEKDTVENILKNPRDEYTKKLINLKQIDMII